MRLLPLKTTAHRFTGYGQRHRWFTTTEKSGQRAGTLSSTRGYVPVDSIEKTNPLFLR